MHWLGPTKWQIFLNLTFLLSLLFSEVQYWTSNKKPHCINKILKFYHHFFGHKTIYYPKMSNIYPYYNITGISNNLYSWVHEPLATFGIFLIVFILGNIEVYLTEILILINQVNTMYNGPTFRSQLFTSKYRQMVNKSWSGRR